MALEGRRGAASFWNDERLILFSPTGHLARLLAWWHRNEKTTWNDRL